MINTIKEKIKNNKLYFAMKLIIVTIFSITIFLDSFLIVNGGIFGNIEEVNFTKIKYTNVLILIGTWIISFIVITLLELIIDKINGKLYKNKPKSKKSILLFFITLIVLLICWLPYILSYFPGGIFADTINTINQAAGRAGYDNHNPILYALIFKVFIVIGDKIQEGLQLGIELFSIFQVFVMAEIISFFVYWLYKKGVSKKYLILTIVFFGICRLIPLYAISLWKDTPFSLALFLYIIFIAEIIYQNGKNLEKPIPILIYNLLLLGVAFLRNNGKYIVFATTIILFIVYRKELIKGLKKFFIISIISLVITFVIQGPVYNLLKINTEFVENLGVPMQQICYVVSNDGNITEEQKEFINNICPIEVIKEKFAPCIIDNVKWDESFNNEFLEANKKEFFKVWSQVGIQNPLDYIKEYLLNTIGFWDVNKAMGVGYTNPTMWNTWKIADQRDLIEEVAGNSIRTILIPKQVVSSAIFLFILLVSAMFTIYNKKYKNLLICVPAFLTWVTVMIAAPLAFSFRYVYILLLSLPLTILMPFFENKDKLDDFYKNKQS